MSVWLVVPLRSFLDGKKRLAPILDAGQRADLVKRLFLRTLGRAAEFPGLGRTLVVTACEQARASARACGVQVLDDPAAGGLNNALAQARSAVRALGGTLMLVVSSDLPLLEAEDLRYCAQASSEASIVVAPDRTREGTNGLCLPTSCDFDFAFGEHSFARHQERIRRLRMQPVIVERPGTAFDVDLPAHLAELEAMRPAALPEPAGRSPR